MLSNTNIEATSGTQFNLFSDVNSQQNPQPNNTKGGETKKQNNITKEVIADDNHQTSFLFTEKTKTTETPTDTSVTATNADDYTRNTAGGNARPTPISADFAENIELNKTLLTDFIEALLDATPPEHKNPVEAALNALRYTNKYKLTIPCLLDAFVCGLVKLNVPKEIIKLTTPILCEVLPDTTPELVERKLNEENNGFELEFFSQYHAENYDNFAGKFVDNSWLEMLNNENRLKFEPCEVLEMPPAEPEISQATGTDGDLPTQKLASIIDNAEAGATATANNEVYNCKKGMTPERNLKMIISQQTNNNNAENITQNANSDVNSQITTKIKEFNNITNDSKQAKFFYDNFCQPYSSKYNIDNPHEYFKYSNFKLYSTEFINNENKIYDFNVKIISSDKVKKLLQKTTIFSDVGAELVGTDLLVLLLKNNSNENNLLFIDNFGNNYFFNDIKGVYCKLSNHNKATHILTVENLQDAILCLNLKYKCYETFEIFITPNNTTNNTFKALSNLAETIDNKNRKIAAIISKKTHKYIGSKTLNNVIYFPIETELYLIYSQDENSVNNYIFNLIIDFTQGKYFDATSEDDTPPPQIPAKELFAPLTKWDSYENLTELPEFPISRFPKLLIETCNAIADATGIEKPFIMLNLLLYFAFSVQGICNLKSIRDAKEKGVSRGLLPLNLYGLNIIQSSGGKNTIDDLLKKGTNKAMEIISNIYQEKLNKYNTELEYLNTEKKSILEKIKKAKDADEKEHLKNNLQAINNELSSLKQPLYNAFIAQKTTIEKLREDFDKISPNIYQRTAEGLSFFANYSTQNNLPGLIGDYANFFSGTAEVNATKGGGTERAKNVRLTVNISIQTGPFNKEVKNFVENHFAIEQGFFPRFLTYKAQPQKYIEKDVNNTNIVEFAENPVIEKFNNIICCNLTPKYTKDNFTEFFDSNNNLAFKSKTLDFKDLNSTIIAFNKLCNKVGKECNQSTTTEKDKAFLMKLLENIQKVAANFHLCNETERLYNASVANGEDFINYENITPEIPLQTFLDAAAVVNFYSHTQREAFKQIDDSAFSEVKAAAVKILKRLLDSKHTTYYKNNQVLKIRELLKDHICRNKEKAEELCLFLESVQVLTKENTYDNFYTINPEIFKYSLEQFKSAFID